MGRGPVAEEDDDPTMTPRKYRDGEVRKILEVAAERDAESPRSDALADGLTLAEIQSIAREVGIPPDAVAHAAASLDVSARSPRTSWGVPIEVRRVVPLPRAPTDGEWERLVGELRTTFRARGRVSGQGSLREWSNGNLHVCVEPIDEGYRLRMGTLKGDAEGINALGVGGILAGGVVLGATAIGAGEPSIAGALVLGLSGAGTIVANLVRLPRWAGRRARQMARIEAKALAILEPATIAPEPPDEADEPGRRLR